MEGRIYHTANPKKLISMFLQIERVDYTLKEILNEIKSLREKKKDLHRSH